MNKSKQLEQSDSPDVASDDAPEVTTAQVLAEVERRRTERREPPGRAVIIVDRFVFWFSKHWLALFNTFFLLYVGLPILAPVLMHLGVEGPAKILYTVYRPLCHQLPQRSFFLFGPQSTYSVSELIERSVQDVGLGMAARAFVGNGAIGFKIGLCQRDVAIYGLILLFGLLFGLLRPVWKIAPLRWWVYIGIGVMPMLLDGGYQFISYAATMFWPDGPIAPHETTPAMRVITGSLFGLATVWLSYPIVQEAMDELRESLHRRFGWE